MHLEHMTDDEFVRRLRAGGLTPAEDALLFRLERALDKKAAPGTVGQHGAQYSLPWEMGWRGVEDKQ